MHLVAFADSLAHAEIMSVKKIHTQFTNEFGHTFDKEWHFEVTAKDETVKAFMKQHPEMHIKTTSL